MTTVVRALEDPGEVLAPAAAFLSSDPVRHNLVRTILHDRVGNPAPGRYWIVNNYVRPMVHVSSRLVVGTFAATRVAIGVAFALAPDRLNTPSEGYNDTLMTRSFAVREIVLGIGGLAAVTHADRDPSAVRTWAGLGALTDAGDLAASLAGGPGSNPAARLPALTAAIGLAFELWAWSVSGQA